MKRANRFLQICTALTAVFSTSQLRADVPWAGGPVIQNPRVIAIYWGEPDQAFSTAMNRFYSQIVGTSYVGGLSEYGTGAVRPGPTNFRRWFGNPSEQVIGTGSFVASNQPYVVQASLGGNVETTDIGPTLDHEIHVGHIPGPDRNTIYMIHFSKAWTLYLGTNILGIPVGAKAGQGFCAYHAAYYSDYTSRAIVYGAIPNQATLPSSCKTSRNSFDGETWQASHELVEAITDPGAAVVEGGFLSVGIESADQAWREPNGFLGLAPNEIADKCRGTANLRTSGNSADFYLVAQRWSNAINDYLVSQGLSNSFAPCTVSKPIGFLDSVQYDSGGTPHLLGWSLDPNIPQLSIPVHIYFDGPYPFGKGFQLTASVSRPDVNSVTGNPGVHGFDFPIPVEYRDGKSHAVYAYGIGETPGNNGLLSNAPAAFNSGLHALSLTLPMMLASAQNPGQCMDLTGVSRASGTPMQLYTCLGTDNQRFNYHADTQELRAYNDSTMCVDASSGLGKDGDRLILWPCNGDPNQKWAFNADNGEIRGVNGKCVDATGGNVANGTAVQIWSCNRGSNQSWFRK